MVGIYRDNKSGGYHMTIQHTRRGAANPELIRPWKKDFHSADELHEVGKAVFDRYA